jgi:hypothetical protein
VKSLALILSDLSSPARRRNLRVVMWRVVASASSMAARSVQRSGRN